jgi:transcription initiation factor TFIIIB Brf1 subunit/transcription initiation factor TFIIB
MGQLSREAIERNPPEGKRERTDLGIAIAHAVSPKRRRWTLDEIAVFAGVTESAIVLIEQRALRKLRKKFKYYADPKIRELVSHYCE